MASHDVQCCDRFDRLVAVEAGVQTNDESNRESNKGHAGEPRYDRARPIDLPDREIVRN